MNMNDEEINYDYEEIDYASSENYYEQTLTGSKYEILPQSTLFSQLEVLVNKTMEMTALPFGWSLLILG